MMKCVLFNSRIDKYYDYIVCDEDAVTVDKSMKRFETV